MNRRKFIQTLSTAALADIPMAGAGGTSSPHKPLPAWFHQAAFGLFLHWGPASVGAVEVSWGMFQDVHPPNPFWPVEKYDALFDQFDPQNYDPDHWMEAAARGGFKYAVLVARHVDGYALWPSDFGSLSTKQKMHGRDLVRPYVEACRKNGLRVGFYYCPSDWTYNPPGWPNRAFPRRDPEFYHSSPQKLGIPKFVDMPAAEMQKYFEQFYAYVKGQVGELMTRYGQIDLLWWDGYDWPETIDIHGDDMQNYVRGLQPDIILNDRYCHWADLTRKWGDYDTHFEAKDPTKRPAGVWEQCEQTCVGWSWRGESAPCRPASHLIERLVRNRAWGGNYLPDFGPRPDGTLSRAHYEICQELAEWMKHCSASVFDVEAGPYPERSDAPVTVKGDVWYIHFLPGQKATATLKGVPAPKKARWLRMGESTAWQESNGGIVLSLPAGPRDPLDEVVEVTF